ncbi:hypothetical protein TRFO_29660 [Tritrichomonas foetus]|uniref:Transmembrane amino acid transporter protein n=1 Tax=Tritrichomonas foetus TaxID=1144522 RepID=A0A1J4JVK4_9EUKA|nr:hypothetical protein TRFO_29660 [Tritrichomonas foetus]|eukprot:OHT03043.1 hypothetical protein TRFO_29660 [Tritrichomonas foetus]
MKKLPYKIESLFFFNRPNTNRKVYSCKKMDRTKKGTNKQENEGFHTTVKPSRKYDDLLYKKDPRNPSLSMLHIIVIMLNANFGKEPYFTGFELKYGFVLMILGVIILYLFTLLSYFVFIKCWIYGNNFSYRTIWEYSIGRYLVWLPEVLIFLNYYRWTIDYFNDFYQLFVDVVFYFTLRPPSFLVSEFFVVYAILSLISFIFIVFASEIHSFLVLSYIGDVSLIVTIILLLVKLIQILTSDTTFDFTLNSEKKWNNSDLLFSILFYLLGIFSSQPILEHIVQIMKTPTFGRLQKCFIISTFSVFLINIIHTIFGFFFYSNLDFYTDFSFNMDFLFLFDPKDKLVIEIKFFTLINHFCTIVVMLWMESRHLIQIFDSCSWELDAWKSSKWLPHLFSCITVVLLCAATNFANEQMIKVANYSGVVSFLLLVFFLPGIFYMKMFPKERFKDVWWVASMILVLIGFVLGVFCLYGFFATHF